LPPQQVFIRALQKEYPELEIVIVSFEYPYHKEPYLWHGIKVTSFGSVSRLFRQYKVNKTLNKIAREKRLIGVLSFWCIIYTLAGKRLADKYNLRHYCWILGQDAKKDNKAVRDIKPQSSGLIALSDFIADEFEKNHAIRPAHIVPPGINPDLFTKPEPVKDIDIVAAGSLIPLKQYHVFIQVIAAVQKQLPGIKAVLSGKGPEKDKLESMIARYGLQNNITLTGELPHNEVLQLMQRAKVFLHPSSYEGFGVVCIEALYARTRVISFYKPMKQEIENWHIVRSEEGMIATALQLLQKPVIQYPVSPFLAKDAARSMMQLFGYDGYKEATTL
jgi:glycosyltransferase involved in cell wall biosynthesis